MAEDTNSTQTQTPTNLSHTPVHSDPTQDPSSPYYLHPSESASTRLVSTVFDGTSFSDWKRSMVIGLNAKNKMCFVDGSLPMSTAGSVEDKAWRRCNNMVTGWLISSLEKHLAKSVMYFKTASAI
jgi:LTR polyprotein gag-polypeptide-like protein